MDQATPAPGGDADIGITVVPASDDTPLSVREAANSVLDFRRKQDAKAEAPPEAAAPEPDSAKADEAAPAQEATGEQPTETTEPAEELPPIEPPRSWTKEQKSQFSNLPREAQEIISAREQDRETALRRGQNELAEQRKQAEAAQAQLNEALKQYAEATQAAVQFARQSSAGEFADIKTPEDISKLAAEDPLRFTRYQAHLMNVQQIETAARQAQEQQHKQYQAQWSEWSAKEDAKFLEMAPEMADKATAQKVADASVGLLKQVGLSDQDLAKLWNGEASLSLRDHRVQLLLLKAAKYDEAQKTAPQKVAAKPVPPVQKPGVTRAKGADDDLHIKNLEKQLERTGSLKDATALMLAKRSIRQ